MPQRPIRSLAVVGVLALGDYVLWNWSVGANHDVVALVAGVTLIPLLIALTWLVVVALARLLAHIAQRSGTKGAGAGGRAAGRNARAGGRHRRSRVGVAAARTSDTRAVAAANAQTASPAGSYPALGNPATATPGLTGTESAAASPSSKLAA